MSSRYKIATNKYTKKELKERRLAKKKAYGYYTRNQQMRVANPNIRQIRNGEVISTWEE